MPSPIAHAAMGYLIYQTSRPYYPQDASKHIGPFPQLLMVTVCLSVLPDLDAVAGILSGDFGRFHNNLSNSLTFGIAPALGVGAFVWLRRRSGFISWFILALLCYELHVLMDFMTVGRGVMLLWPFSLDRFESPVKLFYGLHWSSGWVSTKHLLTLGTELGFVAFVGGVHLFQRKRCASSDRDSVGEL